MTEENASNQEWDKLSEVHPERTDVEVPDVKPSEGDDGEGDGDGSLSSNMLRNPKQTDAQVWDNRLYPQNTSKKLKYLNLLQVARIFPEQFPYLFDILVKGVLEENEEMSDSEAITIVMTNMTIGVDGEGRIEVVALAGARMQDAKDEKAALP